MFDEIRADYVDFATRLQVRNVHFIPISALTGDNVVDQSVNMPWYRGVPLLDHLETVHVASDRNLIDLRFPVQLVMRQDMTFRGYSGTLACGILRPGAEVDGPAVAPAHPHPLDRHLGRRARAGLPAHVGVDHRPPRRSTSAAATCWSIRTTSRGCRRSSTPSLVWMSETPLDPKRTYRIKHTTREAHAEVAEIRYRFDVNTLHRAPADSLALNEIGRVRLQTSRPLAFDPYRRNRATGSFILIDPVTNGTVAAGMILDRDIGDDEIASGAPARAARGPVKRRASRVGPAERGERLGQRPATVWLTGLVRSGKSTIAYALERRLFDAGYLAHVLDGENLRLGISDNLGFGATERSENVRRAAHVARLGNDAGLITIVALVSPEEADRAAARAIIGDERFLEVHLSAPVEACEARDDEGLYRRARSGEIPRFTGVSAPYEAPRSPALELPTHELPVEEAVNRLIELLTARGALRR